MDTNYLTYNFVNIEDSLKPNYTYTNNQNTCINSCNSESVCQGVSISDPICTNSISLDECIKTNITNGISTIEPENLTNYKCNFLTNINNSNYLTNNKNNNSFIKKEYVNILNNISLDKNYYLKINNNYIGIDNKQNQLFLVNSNDISSSAIFKFQPKPQSNDNSNINSNINLVDVKTNKCVEINGDYLVLKDCDQSNDSQKFFYENKSNTIISGTNSFDKNLCFTSNTKSDTNNIILEECDYTNNKNQSVFVDESSTNSSNSSNSIKENFKSNVDMLDMNNLKNMNFCSNTIYKTIVTIILSCILIYFIWYLTRKQYKDNGESDLTIKSSIIN